MITGYNTDVRFEDAVYHVQSEDRGRANPVLDTLIYCKGQILEQVKTNYRQILGDDAPESAVSRMLEEQHREVLRRVRQGHFAPRRTLAGAEADTGHGGALIEAIEALLVDGETGATGETWETLALEFIREGGSGALRGMVRVRTSEGAAAPGARVTARLVGVGIASAAVFESETDDGGQVAISVPLPEVAVSAVVFAAERGPGGGRLRIDL